MSDGEHSGGVASSPDALPLERSHGGSLSRPHRDAFQLTAVRTSVAEARRLVLARLREWGIDAPARDDAQLVVSELFTNAVRHTDSEKIGCALRMIGSRLRVEVIDQGRGPTVPLPRHAGVDGESGRGLLLVTALAEDWGVRTNPDGPGHSVWAELRAVQPARC